MRSGTLAAASIALFVLSAAGAFLIFPAGKPAVRATIRKVPTRLKSLAERHENLQKAITEKEVRLRELRNPGGGSDGAQDMPLEVATLDELLVLGEKNTLYSKGVKISNQIGARVRADPNAGRRLIEYLRKLHDDKRAYNLVGVGWDAKTAMRDKGLLLDLVKSTEVYHVVRAAVANSLAYNFDQTDGALSREEANSLMSAVQGLLADNREGAEALRSGLADLAAVGVASHTELAEDLREYLRLETDQGVRASVITTYLDARFSARAHAGHAEKLLLESLSGTYGNAAARSLVQEPLIRWFRPDNAEALSRSLEKTALLLEEEGDPREVVAQLGTLYFLHRVEPALEAIRRFRDRATEPYWRSTLSSLVQEIERDALDLDALFDICSVKWEFRP